MEKIDVIINWTLTMLFVALAVGSFGAFFFGWRWHLILIGLMSGYIAIGMMAEFFKNDEKK